MKKNWIAGCLTVSCHARSQRNAGLSAISVFVFPGLSPDLLIGEYGTWDSPLSLFR